MNHSMLGIIDATSSYESLASITESRTLAAVPIGGRYRLIDFALSNMVNSGITSVAIFPRRENRSLMDHLGSGKNWDLARKKDGLFIFNPICTEEYFGTLQHFSENLAFLQRARQQYVLISPANVVSSSDFEEMLARHIESGADITTVRHNGRLLNMFILERKLLIHLLENKTEGDMTTMADVVTLQADTLSIRDYEYEGYVSIIDSLHTYYQTNLELLNPQQWKRIFKKERPVFTKVKDEPPTRYKKEAAVKNSIVANGAYIEGTVENSVLFRSVKVGQGTIIRNSIIMQKCQIGENCVIEGVILDKDVKVEDGVHLVSTEQGPVVLKKGTVQGEMIKK